ncbi:PNCB phosphoribosyltransferase, partial [Calyptomena viridis]|nr:PNCB phosphoribosyltransferase [Calyptomena viridis]
QLVEVNGSPCLKLTEDEEKATFPGIKSIYRLRDAAGELGNHSQNSLGSLPAPEPVPWNPAGHPFMDLMALEEEPAPKAGQELRIRILGSLGETSKVIPSFVEPLQRIYFRDGQVRE